MIKDSGLTREDLHLAFRFGRITREDYERLLKRLEEEENREQEQAKIRLRIATEKLRRPDMTKCAGI